MRDICTRHYDDRILLVDVMPEACFQHDDEDATELLTVICDGDPRSRRGFDYYSPARFQHDAYRNRGAE